MTTDSRSVKGNPRAAVDTFLKDARWKPDNVHEEAGVYAYDVTFGDDYPVVGCRLELHEAQQQFVSYLLLEPPVSPDRRAAATEFMTRVNYGMKIGNFEMDLESGAVRYKSSVCYAGLELSKVLVYTTVFVALNSVKPYADAYLGVVTEEQDPAEAVAAVEG
jgi:hypothetical protein